MGGSPAGSRSAGAGASSGTVRVPRASAAVTGPSGQAVTRSGDVARRIGPSVSRPVAPAAARGARVSAGFPDLRSEVGSGAGGSGPALPSAARVAIQAPGATAVSLPVGGSAVAQLSVPAPTLVPPRTPHPSDTGGVAAPVGVVREALNTVVVGFFDTASRWLSSLPANPVSEWLSGALLLVRRTWFNESPTVSPVQQWSDGQLHGHLRARDAEGEQLSYSVLVAPENGSLELDQHGFYKYTPAYPGRIGPRPGRVRPGGL